MASVSAQLAATELPDVVAFGIGAPGAATGNAHYGGYRRWKEALERKKEAEKKAAEEQAKLEAEKKPKPIKKPVEHKPALGKIFEATPAMKAALAKRETPKPAPIEEEDEEEEIVALLLLSD